VHISKGSPTQNSTKVWLTQKGGCIVANNNSKIPEKELREILEIIANNYFLTIARCILERLINKSASFFPYKKKKLHFKIQALTKFICHVSIKI
jgi:hypothetical protein